MTPEVFREATNVSRETLDRLRVYADCLTRWQSRINLVARDSLSDLWGRHMLDSAQLVPHISGGSGTVTDLGSGAGFPGLVISIITGQEARLIEADERKAAFLREAIRLTEAPATVHNVRIEAIEPWPTRFITARALAPLDKLIALAWPFLEISADISTGFSASCLLLKGAKWRDELTNARKSWHIDVETSASQTHHSGRVLVLRDIAPRHTAPK